MNIKQTLLATTIPLFALMAPSYALEKQSVQTLGSNTDVWRVELRNLERFLAMSSGDRDGVSELYKIKIELKAPQGQFHSVTEENPFLSINGGSRSRKNSIDVRRGDRVFLERLEPGRTDTYNLWVHSKQRAQGDASAPQINFQIETSARELDCTGNRVCNRGSTATSTYYFNLPVPAVRSQTCNPGNSYRIRPVNGGTISLVPMTPTAAGIRRNVETARPINNRGAPTDNGLVGPHLAIQSGDICIASTR